MTARIDHTAATFTASLVVVNTAAGRCYRKLFLKPDKAEGYAEKARAFGGQARVETVAVSRRSAS